MINTFPKSNNQISSRHEAKRVICENRRHNQRQG